MGRYNKEVFFHYVRVFDEFLDVIRVFCCLVLKQWVCLLFTDFFDLFDVVVDVQFFDLIKI